MIARMRRRPPPGRTRARAPGGRGGLSTESVNDEPVRHHGVPARRISPRRLSCQYHWTVPRAAH
eukprot:46103-Hanusia_phi.AAC.2